MLRDTVGTPWRLALAGVVATAIGTCATPPPTSTTSGSPMTWVHVKFRSAGAAHAVHARVHEPLFTHLSAATLDPDDARVRWTRVRVAASSAASYAARLAREPDVEQAFVMPETTLPNWLADVPDRPDLTLVREDPSCPITTPSFESYQGYLGPAPHGIDAPAAWRRGYRGAGVWFADIEGGWNATHEDLPGERISHVAGRPINDPSWRAHGTAVLGEVVGRDNGKGIAPDVERVFTASIGGIAVANAIDAAANKLRAGDVLLIELQSVGPRRTYIPVEYFDDVYDAIAAATQRGVIVIEAAGNGAENLDHRAYDRKFDRARRDSGAIMIGAGGPPRDGFRDRERLDFSNYGTRVDVQGWGRKVATLDYGDLQQCDHEQRANVDRDYTNEFSGTSSASPIVAGAAVILEGVARARGKVLAPAALRELLRHTGTPQAGDTTEPIGPRPDLARALRALDSLATR